MKPLSKSSILSYEHCPYAYYLQKIKRLVPKVVPKALIKGSKVHDLMDTFYDIKGETVREKAKVLCAKKDAQEYHAPIKNFIKFNEKLEKQKYEINPILRESKLIDYKNNIIGIIDCVHKTKDKLILLDYKTGKKHSLKKYRFELALYAHLLEVTKNITVTHWGILFVDHSPIPVIEPISRVEMLEALDKVENVRANILAENFERKPSRLCAWCTCYQNNWCNGKMEEDLK